MGDSSQSRGNCRYKGPEAESTWDAGGTARWPVWLKQRELRGECGARVMGQGRIMQGRRVHCKDIGFILNEMQPLWGFDQRPDLV